MPARRAMPTLIVLLMGVRAVGAVYSYECDSLPRDAGWTLLQAWCSPQEWVADGKLYHHVEFCPGYDPPQGQQFDYTHSLDHYLGSEEFFVTWRVQTDGVRSELPFTAPAAFVVWNGGSVDYHLTIAEDQLRFIRDNRLPVLYPEVYPGVPHSYLLEFFVADLYLFYIDGELVDSGVPEGPFPSGIPKINIRAKAQFVESTTIWDYIRWGDIPARGSGDFDTDRGVDLGDFYFFHECLTNRRPRINGGPDNDAGPGCRFADFDDDTDVDLRDVADFQNTFTGGD